MLSLVNHHIKMTDTMVQNQAPSAEEILEDGEIDDEEEEIITEETEIVEETESAGAVSREGSQDSYQNAKQISRSESVAQDNNEDNESSEEEKKRSHKKHQRKRKKHRDSKEKELRALEKKERRRKRKMHAHEDVEESLERGGSSSPHSRRRKKRKKRSRDHRDSSTPESDDSVDQYPRTYYGHSAGNGYIDEYGNEVYPSAKISGSYNMNSNSSSAYYSTTADQTSYTNNDPNNYEAESGSDFEAQLAEYQNYKTHGDSYSKEDKKRGKKYSKERDPKSKADEMYAEFMEYEENPRRACKFFAEGKCLKGNECSFSHDQTTRHHRSRTRRREMCKYYLAGHCHHGNHCTYMHSEYPCKYFHTGATCYAGDNCRFSHDPPTEETKEIIDHFKDMLTNVDDSWEISELKKSGIEVRPKPRPGVGLLPTPDMPPLTEMHGEMPMEGGSLIPSIFDISVMPTADFQKRIEENVVMRMQELDTACALLQLSSVASLSMTDESEGTAEHVMNHPPPGMYPPPIGIPPPNFNGNGLLPTPAFPPDSNSAQNQQNSGSDGFYDNFYEGERAMEGGPGSGEKPKVEKSDEDFIKTDDEFIRIDNSTTTDEERTEDAPPVKAPDFLPATQKALFMRIHGKRVTTDSDKDTDKKNQKGKDPDAWTYSSDEDEKDPAADGGIIKIDTDVPAPSTETPLSSSASMETLLKMIASKGGSAANLDTNLLSKVASVISMSTSSAPAESYNPASSVATYSPAHTKQSPRHPSTPQQPQPRERRSSGSTSASPGQSSKHHRPHPIRRRLSTQELTKEPVVIPLVAKQSGNQTMHSSHPDPRITLSRLIGVKLPPFTGTLPRFSKDLILPGSGKLVGLKVTLSSDDSKPTKRDPRLGRHKDPRLQRASDPRIKSRGATRPSASPSTSESKSSVPAKPSALLTKSSASIPSLPELDLNLAHLKQSSKENGDPADTTSNTTSPSYSLPNLKLPRLVKAPGASPSQDIKPSLSPARDVNVPPPTIAPYDPRYMSSGPPKSTGSDLPMNTAPYDPRVLSSHSSLPAGMEIKKRTIQLPKLTPAPTYKPSESSPEAMDEKPEGDQGDF